MLKETLEEGRKLADAALERLLPPAEQRPTSIHQAMRHSVFAGGKRLRPILCVETGRVVAGSPPKGIEDLGAALEMLHTYSLIHDDLPALDNDDLRRGRPTSHKVFGEAIAILAGDALQTQAYESLAQLICPAEARVAIIREIAHATGISRLRTYGQSIGLAFQIVDDVLDVTQSSEQLGKTAGKDAAAEKTTYPALFGIEESIGKADALVEQACAELSAYGEDASTLKDLAHHLVERKK